jgi:hypothetical protein
MRHSTVAALLIGWLLGIATAFAVPTLVYQRQSIVSAGQDGPATLTRAIADGWIVTRQDGAIWTLERPRFRIP